MDALIDMFQAIVVAGLLLGLLVKPWDLGRVRSAVRRKGGKIVELEAGPYSIGWLAGTNPTIHELEYVDAEGQTHMAEVATSLVKGVIFISDIIMPKAKLLRKSPRNPEAAAAARKASGHHHPGFPSGLRANETRRPRKKMARME
ncbi:MAG: hypothetical protein KF712_04855 [Akkermansiaceae bacterium]|nr:hypothetical protein [Akkermansiaceae bacterium]